MEIVCGDTQMLIHRPPRHMYLRKIVNVQGEAIGLIASSIKGGGLPDPRPHLPKKVSADQPQ